MPGRFLRTFKNFNSFFLGKEVYMEAEEILREMVGDPVEEHTLVYDSASDSLEPLYFWILDKANEFFAGDVEKLIDNFTSSPGSGHFSELGAKATRMQEEAMKILGAVNQVIKSILNLIYDLKEFEIRLSHYEATRSKDKDKAEAGILSLKQIWMDSVDIKRGVGSINSLSRGELMFATLRDAFMIVKSPEDVEDLDLNDRVRRILKPRIQEFLEWKDASERELKKRYEVEKTYLKSQVSSLQLYTRWVKPYLRAAAQLEMKTSKNPALVTAFNTLVMELTLFGKKMIKVADAVYEDQVLPLKFATLRFKRKYYSCILIEFLFRGIPQTIQRQQVHYTFGGRSEVTFKAYALNEDEIALLQRKLKESDVMDAFQLAAGVTDETLDQIKGDLEHFLGENFNGKGKGEEKSEDVNPFAALFDFGGGKERKKEIEKKGDIKKDSYYEKVLRALVVRKARDACFNIYDIYKKAHDMASHRDPTFEYFERKQEAPKQK